MCSMETSASLSLSPVGAVYVQETVVVVLVLHRCRPYGTHRSGPGVALCYTYPAPTELKAQAYATFQQVFDLLILRWKTNNQLN